MKASAILSATFGLMFLASAASAAQFSYLDPAYVQEIYTGPLVGGPGMAWTSTNQLLTKDGSNILEYSLTQNAVHQGTPIHNWVTHPIAGLSTTGYGMTNGQDGYIYTTTQVGLQRFNPSNWAAPAQTLAGTVAGTGYGITTLPDGRIAYCAGPTPSDVYVYDPVGATNTWIYSAAGLIDDIEASPTGEIALAGQTLSNLIIISSTGSLVNMFSTPHYPDGLAFGDGAVSNSLFSNNNDGTITQYALGAGYTGVPVITDIATGSGAYGDLAAVGPDCAFYVTQFDNYGYHGSTWGVGTHWDNGVTDNEPSIIRISAKSGECLFAHNEVVPEPTTAAMLLLTGAGVMFRRRR
ncbi:MAG: PEP-CTERM sorting domain-containing protein [Phycisphaeraceae bacterium]|nr:PEP-CTERM sorting domain-containing protein [Phycisphaeraceae bacterium]